MSWLINDMESATTLFGKRAMKKRKSLGRNGAYNEVPSAGPAAGGFVQIQCSQEYSIKLHVR